MAGGTLKGYVFRKPFPERARQQAQDVAQELVLNKGELWRAQGSDGRQVVKCIEGVVWVTQTGDGSDHILQAGDAFLVAGSGKTVVEAIHPARVQVRRLPPIPSG